MVIINIMNRYTRILLITVIFVISFAVVDLLTIIGFGVFQSSPKKVDAVIVLGARVGTPALTERTLKGLKYYQDTNASVLVLSGSQGSDEPISEAQAMQDVVAKYIAKNGGEMPSIVLEDKSINTYQNINFSQDLIPQAKSIVVVSDTFHLARSVVFAKRAGFNKVYWGAPVPKYYPNNQLVMYYIRETVAMIAYIPKFITN